MKSSPIKEEASALGLEVYEPKNVNSEESVSWCRLREADAFVLFAYGQILKQGILSIPRWAVNVHPSLLPRYRGAAPLERAIMAGESETGITIIQMSEKVDAGGILLQERMPIEEDDTLGELAEHVSRAVPFLVEKALEGLKDGFIKPAPQPLEGVTKAPKIRNEERQIDWTRPGWVVHNHVRAFSPEPLAFTYLRGRRLEIVRSRLADREMAGRPGSMDHSRGKLLVQCGIGLVELVEVKPEGKKQMSALAFANGYRPGQNELLGNTFPPKATW
jgi:methionyl-tRNA formyltransferase